MVPVYAALIAAYKKGQVSFANVTTFNLDEYVGLQGDHPASYRATMNDLLFDHVDIDKAATFVPNGCADNLNEAAHAYETQIQMAGGVDLQLLGIGRNGHIGFNEPGSSLESRTRVVELTESTRTANKRFFVHDVVPTHAVTMGIGTILEARKIILQAIGESKRAAVAQALRGAVTTQCPASALQRHPDVLWHLDQAAAGELVAA